MAETITLMGDQVCALVVEAVRAWPDLPADDERIMRALGWFFAVNPEMADYAKDIQEITLTLKDEDMPSDATVKVKRHDRIYTLSTARDGLGVLPPIPWKVNRSKRKRRRRKQRP